VIDRTLALAVRDPTRHQPARADDDGAGGGEGRLAARLSRLLQSRAERDRAQAAAAAIRLRRPRPNKSVKLLEPLLEDPSHDVRVAMMPGARRAYARPTRRRSSAPAARSEANAMRRLRRRGGVRHAGAHPRPGEGLGATLAKVAKDDPRWLATSRSSRSA